MVNQIDYSVEDLLPLVEKTSWPEGSFEDKSKGNFLTKYYLRSSIEAVIEIKNGGELVHQISELKNFFNGDFFILHNNHIKEYYYLIGWVQAMIVAGGGATMNEIIDLNSKAEDLLN